MKIGSREQRAEYSRLRSILRKRLNRIYEAGFGDEPIYTQNVHLLKPIKDVKDEMELLYRLADLQQAVFMSPTKVSDYRQVRQEIVRNKPIFARHVDNGLYIKFFNEASAALVDKFRYFVEMSTRSMGSSKEYFLDKARGLFEEWLTEQQLE